MNTIHYPQKIEINTIHLFAKTKCKGSISKRFRRRSPTAFVHGHDPFNSRFELPISTLVTRSQLCIDSSSVVAATVASPCFWSPSTSLTGTTTAVSSPPLHGLVFSVQAVTAREHWIEQATPSRIARLVLSDVQFVVWTKPDGSSICLPHRTFQTTKQTWLNFNILHTWPLRLVPFLFSPEILFLKLVLDFAPSTIGSGKYL